MSLFLCAFFRAWYVCAVTFPAGPEALPFRHGKPRPDFDGIGDGHLQDFPRAEGEAERSGCPRALDQRVAHGLRFRG